MLQKILNLKRKLKYKIQDYRVQSQSSIKLFWWNEEHNFGDALNTVLAKKLTDNEIEWVPATYSSEYFMSIGSVLQEANKNAIIWGSGLIDNKLEPYMHPREILAVRGPLTRRRLHDLKIKCPEIYGDPALIMPELYYPSCEKKYELGIIPHYIDKKNNFFNRHFEENIKIIDINQPSCEDFISEVLSCKKIVASSLHGIIIADAYDIPALRIKFSDAIFGGDFKFNDYFSSIDREHSSGFFVSEKTNIHDILGLNFNYHKKININKLMSANPFGLR